MDMDEVMNHARDAMTVKRVFGDSYEKDGVTIIPVANVMGGAGAGGGTGVAAKLENAGEEAVGEGARTPDTGWGTGCERPRPGSTSSGMGRSSGSPPWT